MNQDEQHKRRAQPRASTFGLEREGPILRPMQKRRSVPGGKQVVEGDAWPVPGPNQPDVEPDEGDEAFQNRRVVLFRKPGLTDTPVGFPSSPEPSSVSPSPVCPRCKGSGWLRRDLPPGHPNFGKPLECGCLLGRRRLRHQRELLALSNLSEEQRELTLQNFTPHVKGVQHAFRSVKALSQALQTYGRKRAGGEKSMGGETPGPTLPEAWVVLIGGVGVGKTHLALAVANAALDAEIVVLFATVPDLLDYLRATFDPDQRGPVYDELFQRMRSVELLVLDDLGTQRSSPWADEKLFQLINHRYSHRLPTIITMNEKAWTYLDDRLQSRLSDRSLVEIVTFAGAQDYRKSAARLEEKRDDPDGG